VAATSWAVGRKASIARCNLTPLDHATCKGHRGLTSGMKPLRRREVVRIVDRNIRRKCCESGDVLDAGKLSRRLSRDTHMPRRRIANVIIERAASRLVCVRW
jgi:hypothetical protein